MLMIPRENELRESQLASIHEYMADRRMLFLYSYIVGFPNRVDSFGVTHVTDCLLTLDMMSHDPIWLFIQSPGGSVEDGLTLIDTMHTIESPVYTVGRSTASMATIVLAAGEHGHRYIYPHTKVMLHLVKGMSGGDPKELKIMAEQAEQTQSTIVELLLNSGVKVDKETLITDIDRDFWLTGQGAIDYGLADRFVEKGLLPAEAKSD